MMDYMFEHFKQEYHDGADIHRDDVYEFVNVDIDQKYLHSALGNIDDLATDLLMGALTRVDWRELETALNDRLKENYELTEEVGGDYD